MRVPGKLARCTLYVRVDECAVPCRARCSSGRRDESVRWATANMLIWREEANFIFEERALVSRPHLVASSL